jgi:hypothetical protein
MPDGINLNTKPATQNSMIEQFSKMSGDSTKTKEVLSKALEVLSGANVKVTMGGDTTATTGERKTSGATSTPALDNPSDPTQVQANLEKLVAYLKLDSDERQSEMAKNRIETNKATLENEYETRKAEIQETLDKMDAAERTRKANKVFGWLMTALAVVVAVAACVATGGIATGAVIGAVIALGCQILNETGAMEKITDGLADGLQKMGMSKQAAQIVAQVAISAVILAASLGAGFAGAGALAEMAKEVATAIKVATTVVGLASLGSSAAGVYQNYKAGTAQADLTETEKFITQLQQRLKESEEELKKILETLQNAISQVVDILSSATDTSSLIAQNIGQMA